MGTVRRNSGICWHAPRRATDKAGEPYIGLSTPRGDRFGNGRAVRNLFETYLRRQAKRLAVASKKLTRAQLRMLSVKDVPEAAVGPVND